MVQETITLFSRFFFFGQNIAAEAAGRRNEKAAKNKIIRKSSISVRSSKKICSSCQNKIIRETGISVRSSKKDFLIVPGKKTGILVFHPVHDKTRVRFWQQQPAKVKSSKKDTEKTYSLAKNELFLMKLFKSSFMLYWLI